MDGSEPDRNSNPVHGSFDIAETTFLRARAFRPGFYPSYTAPLSFRKLDARPSLPLVDAQAGLRYETRELWLCKKTADMDAYPVIDAGIAADFAPERIKLSLKSGVSYSGYISIPTDGVYTFYLLSDDGSVLFIDGELIVDNDGSHRARERSGQVGLQAGFHAIGVQHFQIGGTPKLVIKWQGPGIEKTDIPTEVLFYEKSK